MRPKTSQNRKSLNKHTLSPSITFVNSVFQNLIASSSVKPIPFKKRPYCCLPWWRRWWLARIFWWRCCMHSGKSFFANCIDGKSNIVLSFFFSVYNYFYSTFLNLSKTVILIQRHQENYLYLISFLEKHLSVQMWEMLFTPSTMSAVTSPVLIFFES